VECVEDDQEAITASGVEVLLQVVDDDAARLIVPRKHAEIECIVVVEHSHFRIVGGRFALSGLVLDEVVRQ
jgi:hypothetical protein